MRVVVLLNCVAMLSGAASAADKTYQPPRLSDGRPKFEGVWAHSSATPFTRPTGIATLTITREQANAIEASVRATMEDRSLAARCVAAR